MSELKWQDCIKKLNGYKVITYKGDNADIVKFDMYCNQLGHFIGKYQVRFLHGGAVGWYTRAQLSIKGFEKWL